MGIKLKSAPSGSIVLDVPDNIGSDLSMTIPATAGTILAADPTQLSVDSSGRLLYPARPSFLARGEGTSAVEQPAAGANALLSELLNQTDPADGRGLHNIGNHYDTNTGLFTCPATGLYFCSAHSRWEASSFQQNNLIRTYITTSGTDVDINSDGHILSAITGNNEAYDSLLDQSVAGVLYASAGMKIGCYGGMLGTDRAQLYPKESSFGVTFLG